LDHDEEEEFKNDSSSSSSFVSDISYYDEIVDEYVLRHDDEDETIEIRDKKKQNIDEESKKLDEVFKIGEILKED
jgi:hypothetical protein